MINLFVEIFHFIVYCVWLLIKWIAMLPIRGVAYVFVCSHKGHDYFYRGGGFIFHVKKPLVCDRCGHSKKLRPIGDDNDD